MAMADDAGFVERRKARYTFFTKVVFWAAVAHLVALLFLAAIFL